MKGKIGNGSSLGRVCACVHVRAHILPALIFHFSFFLTTRKNFCEPLHPSPGCTWRDTCARSHTRACLCAHTHTLRGQQSYKLYLGLAGNRALGNLRPRLWHRTVFFVAVHSRERKWGWGQFMFRRANFAQSIQCIWGPVLVAQVPSSGKLRGAPGGLKIRSGHTPCWISGALGKDQEVARQRSLSCRLA